MDQNSWNVVGMQLEVLERSWNIQEWTKNFHSNCIPVHSSSSVIGVLVLSLQCKKRTFKPLSHKFKSQLV